MMTIQEFDILLKNWGQSVKRDATLKLSRHTHSTGALQHINVRAGFSDKMSAHFVGFNFKRYGVFVAYGVGSGWVRQGGTVVRTAQGPQKPAKYHPGYVLVRRPLDWFDSSLDAHINRISLLAANYYGDQAVQTTIDAMRRAKIIKK